MKKVLLFVFLAGAVCSLSATTWTITTANNRFVPDSLDIVEGDTVLFQLEPQHNAIEVSENSWSIGNNYPWVGFSVGLGGGMVTGLAVGTHYYLCGSHVATRGKIIVHSSTLPKVWINELHYDNAGNDTAEGIEIAGPAGTNLGCYTLYLYDSLGVEYLDTVLSGVLPVQQCGYGTLWIAFASETFNNNTSGVALVFNGQKGGCGFNRVDTVLQFISYEGTVTAGNSRIAGQTSVNIGVSEAGSSSAGSSLQLAGSGNTVQGYVWQSEASATPGSLNSNQNFCMQQRIYFPLTQRYEFESAGKSTFAIVLDNPGQSATSVTVALSKAHVSQIGKLAIRGMDFVYNDTVVTWAANTAGEIRLPVQIFDDTWREDHEDFFIAASNATLGVIITADSVFNFGIIGNDPPGTTDCSNLFLSEYVDGAGNNNALEIYNPTNDPIDLSDYKIYKSVDGGVSEAVFMLNGIIAPKDVYVMADTGAAGAITSKADTLSGFFNFDGNDAIALLNIRDTIDIIGELRVNPGSNGWNVDNGTTSNHTLIRERYIYIGKTNWAIADTQWTAHTSGLYDSLGFHHIAPCGMPEPPPPATIEFITTFDTIIEQDTLLGLIIRCENPSAVNASYTVNRYDALSTTTANVDYAYAANSFSHGFGVHYDTVLVQFLDDRLTEATETAAFHFVNLSSNTLIGIDSLCFISIIDTDRLTVAFLGAGFSYTEDAGIVPVKVTISTALSDSVFVNVKRAAGSATIAQDYFFKDTTIVFLPNSMDTQMVWVTILNDTIDEGNEQVNLDLTGLSGGDAILGTWAHTLTIIDDDTSAVGVTEIAFSQFADVWPNPVNNSLNLRVNSAVSYIKVYDVVGQLVFESGPAQPGQQLQVDLHTIPAGMYFISAGNATEQLARRFIKVNN